VLTTVVYLVAILFGGVAYYLIPIDIFPEIELPVISVITAYQGAGAEDIEKRVTKPMEESLGSIKNLDELIATSSEGVSAVSLKFDFGTDLTDMAADVRQYVDMAKRRLPEDIDPPMIFQMDMSQFPIMMLGIVSSSGDVRQEREWVDDFVAEPLRRIPGVGAVVMFGAPEMEVRVELDRDKLRRHDLSLEQVAQRISAENYATPAGSMEEGVLDLTVRVPAEFDNFDQMEDMIVSARGAAVVRLREVGTVIRDLQDIRGAGNVDARPALICGVMRQSGANTVKVADAVNAGIERVRKTLPKHMSIIQYVDNSMFIRRMMDNLMTTMVMALIMVSAVVFIFLRRWRPSIIVAVALPTSSIVAFFALYLMDYTMNMISMMAITLGIGMVVDNAIVVMENITRHVDEFGRDAKGAAVEGTREVGGAIIGSTLTTCAVFGPLVFVSGLISVLFNQLAMVVTLTIGASLLVALTLTPMMCGRMLKPAGKQVGDKLFDAIDTGYSKIIGWALRHRAIVLLAAVMLAGTTFYFAKRTGGDFMPESDSGQIQISIELPVGSAASETRSVAEMLAKELMAQPEVRHVGFRYGSQGQGFAVAFGGRQGSHIASLSAQLVPLAERTRSDTDVADGIRKKLKAMHQIVRADVTVGDVMSRLASGGAKPITYEIRGSDLAAMSEAAKQVKEIIASVDGAKDVTADLPDWAPELRYTIDRDKAARRQVTAASAGAALRGAITGVRAGTYRGGAEDLDITVRYAAPGRTDVEALKKVQVMSMTGRLVSLDEIGSFSDQQTPLQIKRKDKQRVIAVGANRVGRAIGEISGDIEKKLLESGLYSRHDIAINVAGDVQQQRETSQGLVIALLLGLVLVFLVMAAQFESYLDPFVILFSVPFSFTGAFLALAVAGESLSVPAFLGMIILIGIVVNNGIVLVDYVNRMRDEHGMPMFEAVVLTARRRLRAILMTAITTIVGVVPMVFGTGEGSSFWRPLGLATFGGLTLSTAVTLILIPVMYSLFEFARKRRFKTPEPRTQR